MKDYKESEINTEMDAENQTKEELDKGVNRKRYNEIMRNQKDPLVGVFNNRPMKSDLYGQSGGGQAVLDVHKLDFLKLNYKQQIDRMTQDMLE